jgi:hypothetical protein
MFQFVLRLAQFVDFLQMVLDQGDRGAFALDEPWDVFNQNNAREKPFCQRQECTKRLRARILEPSHSSFGPLSGF